MVETAPGGSSCPPPPAASDVVSQMEPARVHLRHARSAAALAALGLTAAAVAVALAPSPSHTTIALGDAGSGVIERTASAEVDALELYDLGTEELELSGLAVMAAERDLAEVEAQDAALLLESIKAERVSAVEQATRDAERARIASAPPREMGQLMAAQRGFTGEQWSCLDSLWQRESNWNPSAQNPSSGAYGIPQALPGSKMATVAADWRTNPATQITWGLDYIVARYGTPCGAWSHSQSHNWY